MSEIGTAGARNGMPAHIRISEGLVAWCYSRQPYIECAMWGIILLFDLVWGMSVTAHDDKTWTKLNRHPAQMAPLRDWKLCSLTSYTVILRPERSDESEFGKLLVTSKQSEHCISLCTIHSNIVWSLTCTYLFHHGPRVR